MIAKKNKAAIVRDQKKESLAGRGSLSTVVKSKYHHHPSKTILKNYIYVQTPTKEALFVSMHVKRIERSAAVKMKAGQLQESFLEVQMTDGSCLPRQLNYICRAVEAP